MHDATLAPPTVVLDTNATLDWMVFADPGMQLLAAAIEAASVRWLATPQMRAELSRTLEYGSLAKWSPNCERTLSHFDRWAVMCGEPISTNPQQPVCKDPDDQVFIDLAIGERARWLVTHDRALHQLARPARAAGVRIVRPRDWRLD